MSKLLSLDEIKEIELSILDYIDSICRESHIRYYLAYGTLLGAVRHQGFIPWDDDIDIYMLREDYMKFIQIVVNQHHERYNLLSIYNDDKYYYEYAKVVDSSTILKIKNVKENDKEGIWVDIFPLDNISNHIKMQKCVINISVACRILSVYTKFPSEKRNKVFYPFWLITRIVGPRFFLKITEIIVKIGHNEEKVGYMASMGVNHFCFPKEWCARTCMLDFEGKKYPAFEQFDEYLRCQYGDYMQLPPEEQRVSHPVEAYWR